MKVPKFRRGSSLLSEIGFLSSLIATLIIIIAELTALQIITAVMTSDLKAHSIQTYKELVKILEEPLYILDDAQVLRIGEAVLSSGRVSGLRIESAASGQIISVPSKDKKSTISPLHGTIQRDNFALGTFYLEFSDHEVTKTRKELLIVASAVIIFVILANMLSIQFLVLSRVGRVFSPIFDCLAAIASGNYEVQIPLGRYSDINELSKNINEMVNQIDVKSRALLLANQTLEDKVTERTAELEASLSELRFAQDRLVESERLSALGQLSADMAHELNTPLGAILSSDRMLLDFFDTQLSGLLDAYLELSDDERSLFRLVMKLGLNSTSLPDFTISNRILRRTVQSQLESLDLKCTQDLADIIVDLGMQSNLTYLEPWLRTGSADKALQIVRHFISARRMFAVIELAGGKAASVVSALQSYLEPNMEKPDTYKL